MGKKNLGDSVVSIKITHKEYSAEDDPNLPDDNQKSSNKTNKKAKANGETTPSAPKDVRITEHLMTVEEVCAKHQTNIETGLTESEAEFRLARDGPNMFTPPKQTPWYVLLFKEMVNGFALLLWLSSIASFIAYAIEKVPEDLYLGVVLALTVLLTGSFSYYQQASSSKVFKSLKSMAPQQTVVIRDGQRRQIGADRVVVGDLVYCSSGDRVPADIRVIKSESMKVDNSSLTGESDPLTRATDIGHENPLEARNLAFFSTNCVDGNGYGIAVATGDRTVMGDIARLVTMVKKEKTPIGKEIARFVKIITVMAVVTGLLFFAISMAFHPIFFEAFVFMIGITIANVPEGLLPAMTVSLTLTAKQMASKNCLVKTMESVETLGATSVICTDKTGTLTQNRMTVEHCWLVWDRILRVSHEREEVAVQMRPYANNWSAYKRCALLCSRAEFLEDGSDIMKRQCSGDASETAILRFMESVNEERVADYRSRHTKVAEKPFSSIYKYQYSIHRSADTDSPYDHFMVMKGAPERIVRLCSTFIRNGHTVPIDQDFTEDFEEAYRELGSMGERVLALCDHEFPRDQFAADHKFDLDDENAFELGNFRFLGLVALIDPPRPTVPDAVAKCRSAGIKVIMVTGDHPITAQAIARQVGIFTNSHRNSTSIVRLQTDKVVKNARSIVVPGDDLSNLTDEELRETLDGFGEIVFARTSPQQKLRIVENCQALGKIVAVTGDGVNDSPALKRADIGIAMGITGSEVSKQAADMILMDDNFATIVTGVEEGRCIYDNMKKTVSYILAGNSTCIWPFIIYVLFGIPLPIGTITCLLITLGTDMVPAISLAYEKLESDIMKLPPRDPTTETLVDTPLLARAYLQLSIMCTLGGMSGYFMQMYLAGVKPHMLWWSRSDWEDENFEAFPYYTPEDDWFKGEPTGQMSYADRQQLQIAAQSAYFVAVVVCQWMDVIINKTRRVSLFRQGMWNWVLNWSLVFETGLAVLCCYTPDLNTVLNVAPVSGWVPIVALPHFVYMLVVEEIRKWVVRRFPMSTLGKDLLA